MASQLDRLCERLKIRAVAQYGGVEVPDGWPSGTHPYKVTLRFRGRRLTVPFFMGPAHEREPSAADVLSCLVSDARSGESTFEEFCSEFGHDTDSRAAEKTWRACVKLADKVPAFLRDAFDDVASAEH